MLFHVAAQCAGIRHKLRAAFFHFGESAAVCECPPPRLRPARSASNSPYSTSSPVYGLRVNATPVPESSPMIAKDHRADVDGRAEIVGNLVQAAIINRAASHPRAKDRFDRELELLVGVLGKFFTDFVLVQFLVLGDDLFQIVRIEVGVVRNCPWRVSRRRDIASHFFASIPITMRPNICIKRR